MAPRADRIAGAGWTGRSDPQPAEDLQALDFLEEEAVPRTTTVTNGEVVIRKYVVTETRTVQVPVRREVVQVYRLGPSGEPVQPAPQAMGPTRPPVESTELEPGGVIWDSDEEEEVARLPLLEEEAVVTTRLVLREEVVVRKLRYHGRRRIAEELRREEPHLETRSSVSVSSSEQQQADQIKEDG